MWIFTRYGFFSIVSARTGSEPEAPLDPDLLMVRARAREHLAALGERFSDRLGEVAIHESPNADYAYRLFVDRRAWTDVLSALAADIDYDNFKAAIARPPRITAVGALAAHVRTLYEEALDDVWAVMFRLQRRSMMRAPGPASRRPEGDDG